jgi:8-oxo-dGTP pyrophosphatase MutT (NUDIX family)
MKQSNDKEKVKDTCASVVLVHDNKVLLLYDKNWNHYVLPQGHKEEGETLRQTAIRETKEETGYNDLELIRKIKQYQYHYPKDDKIIYKSIHVYLISILSLSREDRKFEKHENYTNHFFEFNEAIARARWPQDKEVIVISRKYIKK